MAEHFFASTCWDWVAKEDLFETIDTLHKLSRPANKHTEEIPYVICKVPRKAGTSYKLDFDYVPQVKGTKVIHFGKFKFKIKK